MIVDCRLLIENQNRWDAVCNQQSKIINQQSF